MKTRPYFTSLLLGVIALCGLSFPSTVQGQQEDPIMFEIGGKPVYQSEFRREFLHSIGKDSAAMPTACTYEKRQTLEEYAELFVNYRVKLLDAAAQHIEGIAAVRREIETYRTEIAAPYLIDSATLQRIYREAYDRNHYAVHASHILIACDKNASASDTLIAYTKAMNVYNKAMEGNDFAKLATQYSDDPSARGGMRNDGRIQGNGGDLGCFTVFSMIYPFENAVYSLKPGEISKPIRTSYGYHIIKLHEKAPYYGQTTLQHIWVAPQRTEGYEKVKIEEAYKKITTDGEAFASVARNYSDDYGTKGNGGLLQNLTVNQMPIEYIQAIGNMNNGELSKPFQTKRGWHIIYLIKKDTIPPLEDMIPLYQQRLVRDARNKEPKSTFAEQCKRKYGFVDYTKQIKSVSKRGKKQDTIYCASLDQAVAAMNDSVYRKKWHYADSMVTDTTALMQIANRRYNTKDFLQYIEETQSFVRNKGDYRTFIGSKYKDFITDKLIGLANANLEKENPHFAQTMNEFRDGIIIFAYNDRFVWSKAINDTLGLKHFYDTVSLTHNEDTPGESPYVWNKRAEVVIFTFPDSNIITPQKARKIIDKGRRKNIGITGIKSMLNDGIKKQHIVNNDSITVEQKTVEMGNQNILKSTEWNTGVYEHAAKKGFSLILVQKVMEPQLKTLHEARGYYLSDYQNSLDKELINQLRVKYNVKIHQDVIDAFTY